MEQQSAFVAYLHTYLEIVPTSQEDRLRHVIQVLNLLTTPEGSRLLISSDRLRATVTGKIIDWTEQLAGVRADHPELRWQCDDVSKSIDQLLRICSRLDPLG